MANLEFNGRDRMEAEYMAVVISDLLPFCFDTVGLLTGRASGRQCYFSYDFFSYCYGYSYTFSIFLVIVMVNYNKIFSYSDSY